MKPLRILTLAFACAATAAGGCARFPLRAGYTGPSPVSPEVLRYYDYPSEPPQATKELLDERRDYSRWIVRFPLKAPDFEPTEPTVEIEWFEARAPGRRPAILFSPILGGDYPLERGIARFFARHGFHVALVHRKTLKVSPEHPPEHLEMLLRQAIIRNRQIVDWMQANDRVDPERMGAFGISMGGIATVISAAIDPRLRCDVIILAGGSLADILRSSPDKLLAKPRARYLAHHQMTADQMYAILTETLKTDPIHFAASVDARRSLWFIALADRTIGRVNSLRLWNAAGRPEVIFLPTGHYTSYLYLPYLEFESLRFFKKSLDR